MFSWCIYIINCVITIDKTVLLQWFFIYICSTFRSKRYILICGRWQVRLVNIWQQTSWLVLLANQSVNMANSYMKKNIAIIERAKWAHSLFMSIDICSRSSRFMRVFSPYTPEALWGNLMFAGVCVFNDKILYNYRQGKARKDKWIKKKVLKF